MHGTLIHYHDSRNIYARKPKLGTEEAVRLAQGLAGPTKKIAGWLREC